MPKPEERQEEKLGPSWQCRAPHPLLEDVSCQRLSGHAGRHGAYFVEGFTDQKIEWDAEQEQERDRAC